MSSSSSSSSSSSPPSSSPEVNANCHYEAKNPLLGDLKVRRRRLNLKLPPGGVAVLPAAPAMFVPGTRIPTKYRQEASFRYLPGIDGHQDVIAVVEASPDPTHSDPTFKLFVPERNLQRELWEGKTLSPEEGVRHYGADEAHDVGAFPEYLARILGENRPVIVDGAMWRTHRYARLVLGAHDDPNAAFDPAFPMGGGSWHGRADGSMGGGVRDALGAILHSLRWKKSETELEYMRKSASITAQAFLACMQTTKPHVNESQLSALFEYECRTRGSAPCMPYPQVVASGNNACTIHYSANNAACRRGDLLLMDAGCDFHGYVSDVTRTWPVSGQFTGPQREVYEGLLEVHRRW